MKNRKLLLIVSLVLALTMSLGGTLAYLSDTDADVNVMTLGSVYIVQNEQERGENGLLRPFTQDPPKAAYPAVGPVAWADEKLEVGDGEYKVFTDDLKNVIDKIVTVTNTGKSEAYVRTIIALEAPDYDPANLIHVNVNGDLENTAWTPVEINDVEYVYSVFTYEKALAPNETSAPSLLQLFLDSKADNDFVKAFGDNWEVLVLSQAMQTAGFDSAADALNEGFGAANKENVAKWFEGWSEWKEGEQIGSPSDKEGVDKNETNNPPFMGDTWDGNADTSWFDATQSEFVLTTAEQLAGVGELGSKLGGKTVKLDVDVDLNNLAWTPINVFTPETPFTFDGQGHTVYNLKIGNGDRKNDAGLFDNSTGTIKNLIIHGAEIKISGGRTGVIAGRHYGSIENCHVMNSVVESDYWAAGGIVGLYNSGSIKDCTVTNVSIKSNGGTGGIVGVVNETLGTRTIENCHVYNSTIKNTGTVGEAYTGAGIVGMINIYNSTVNITGCTVDATLEGNYIYEICGPEGDDNTLNIN